MKRFSTHVPLDERTDTYGCILCEHERTVDLKERDAKFKEKVPQDILEEVLNIVHSLYLNFLVSKNSTQANGRNKKTT